MADEPARVFVSYAGPDRVWAEWIAFQLKQAGHVVELDVWDWRAGDDFILRMDGAMKKADVVVALFSDNYFDPKRWTNDEWTATLARRERLVPIVVRPLQSTEIPPTLAAKMRAALHGLDKTAATEALLRAVNGPVPPTVEPAFPGAQEPASTPAPAATTQEPPRLPDSVGTPNVWNVPRRNPDFSGREGSLTALRDGLTSPKHKVPHVLHGLGGVGKTQIALEYAHRFASQYDLVWWIDAEAAGQLPVHLTDLAGRLGIAKPDAGAEANARAVLEHLATRQRWLLILDNAEDSAEFESWLPPGDGHVLITSRSPDWSGVARSLDVDVFTRPESLAFLRERAPRLARDQADGLAEDLGDLPLALDQAVGVLTKTAMPVDTYRRMLADAADRTMRQGGPRSYPDSLAAAVAVSAERLRTAHPEAEPLLRLAAFLGPDPIPTRWFDSARRDLTSLPAGTADDPMWPWDVLPHLAGYGLARLGDESLQIHRLTQAVLRDTTDAQDAAMVRTDVASLLMANDPGDPKSPANWPQWALIFSHLLCVLTSEPSAVPMRHLLYRAALYLVSSGQPRDARDLVAPLHKACVDALGEDHPETLICGQYLGHAMWDLGDRTAARKVIENTYERRRRVLGDDHPDTLHSANDVAVVMDDPEFREKSQGLTEDTLARRRRVLGEDHPDTLQSAHSLASTLHSLQRYPEALALKEDTLERRQRVLGEDHPDTLQSTDSLASTLYALARNLEALALTEDAFARYQRMLGDEHPDTLGSAHGLATTLYAVHRYPEALELNEDTFQRRQRVLGEDHPDTLQSAQSRATTLHALCRYPEALELKEDTLQRRLRVLGEDHPQALESAKSLATTLHALHRSREAESLLRQVLNRFPNFRDDQDPAVKDAVLDMIGLLFVILDTSGRQHQAQMLKKRWAKWLPRPRKKSRR